MTRTRALAILVAGVLIASGCASLKPKYTVGVDLQTGLKVPALGRRLTFDGVFLRYFPRSITLRPEDPVKFNLRDSGEPHTVTFGKLVDEAVGAIEKAGPNASLYDIEDLPELKRLPKPFTRVGANGALRVNHQAADRCFLDDELPSVAPSASARGCRADDQPTFTGKETFYNAGRVSAGSTFEMTLDKTIPPGRYAFMCLIHPTVMRGELKVVGKNDPRPRPGVFKKRAEGEHHKPGEEGDAVRGLAGAGNLAGAATAVNAVAGVPASDDDVSDYLATFGPPDYKVARSKPLTWTLYGLHSITFNRPAGVPREAFRELDERSVINDETWAPADSPPLPSDEAIAARDRKGLSYAIDGGTWDGVRYHSSGIVFARTPRAVTYTLRFAKNGTFPYFCLVHRTMKGKIVVTTKGPIG